MIRQAEIEDIPAIVEMGAAFHAEAGSFVPFDRDSFRASCEHWLEQALFLVSVEESDAVGMICGFVSPLYFNRAATIAHELFFFVHPDHRNGTGKALLAGFATEARRRGATHEIQTTADHMETVQRLYRRNGFQPIERAFVRAL